MFRTSIQSVLPLVLAAGLTLPSQAQQLRNGVWAAEVIVVATVNGVQPLGKDLIVHRLQTLRTLQGEAPERISIVQDKRVSDSPVPVLGSPRICCLRPVTNKDLPEQFRPYFRMTGFAGDHPVVPAKAGEPSTELEFVELLIRSERGLAPREMGLGLTRIALEGKGPARAEAIDVLRSRTTARDTLNAVQKVALLSRAVGETEDLALKCSLASLCAELEMPEVIESLCLAMVQTGDPEFVRTVGRLARFVHREKATEVLGPQIARAREAEVRDRLIVALGATRTKSALEALLKMRERKDPSKAIDAALEAHGTARAIEAIGTKRK